MSLLEVCVSHLQCLVSHGLRYIVGGMLAGVPDTPPHTHTHTSCQGLMPCCEDLYLSTLRVSNVESAVRLLLEPQTAE